MNHEAIRKYNEALTLIDGMPESELRPLLKQGKCPVPTEILKPDVPMGMYHCPICGTMVIAGCPHGTIDPPFTEIELDDFFNHKPYTD